MGVKGYFFTMDALLALILVVTAIVLLSSIQVSEPPMGQINFLAEDLMSVFSELRVGEINNSYVKELIQNGTISQINNTILEQLGEFYAEGKDSTAAMLFYNITFDILDGDNIALFIGGESIYSYGTTPEHILLKSHRMISGVAREKPVRGYVAKAFLTGLNPLKNYVYNYFGGYVGDGNITIKLYLPEYSAIAEVKLELAINSSFNLSVNDFNSGSYIHTALPENEAETFYMNSMYFSNFKAGENNLRFVFDRGGHIGGGFLKIRLNTTFMNYSLNWNGTHSVQTDYLPGIKGVVNLYSSMYVPGNLSSLEIYLDYTTSNMSLFMSIGNTTIFKSNVSQSVTLTDVNLTALNYTQLSQYTTPIRMGHYSTNVSNYTGNVTDAVLTTSRTLSMSTTPPDLPNGTTNITRIEGAKVLDKIFVEIVLNSTGNRVGLVSYKADAPSGSGWDHVLTTDLNSLNSDINDYDTRPGNKCFCCAIAHAYECLLNSECKKTPLAIDGRKKVIILMSDGTAEKDCNNYNEWKTGDAAKDAIAAACYAYNTYGVLTYSIGFGRTANATLLKNISDCGHGKFRMADNLSGLEEIYKEFAAEIAAPSIGYRFQEVISSGVESSLSQNSYIKMTYQPAVLPLLVDKIPITFETRAFNNTVSNGSFYLPLNATPISALLTSYSGDKWTDRAWINGNQFYSLGTWNENYQGLGDPFTVQIPVSLLNVGGINNAIVSTGYGINNESGGSIYDKAIYTLLVSSSASYSGVGSIAKGCNWTLKFEDGSNMSLCVPSSYYGNEICDFETGKYNSSDSINTVVYTALKQLDLDSNGLLDYNLNFDSLSIDTTTVSGVPSLWGPSTVEVRTWH